VNHGRAAVFFDRDGTLNEEVEFLSRPEQLALIPGAVEAVCAVNRSGMAACVISNQSGIARGLFREADLGPIHDTLARYLGAGGAHLDRIYYCPHHPTAGIPPYNIECDCRKPGTGMLRQAERELGIDLRRSFVVGDRLIDVQAGQAAGGKGILVLTGWGTHARAELSAGVVTPDFIAASVREAVEFILHEGKGETGTNE
jgi:D-glycero-D-manno-heptose 1,7-bisphosphate phosphatase